MTFLQKEIERADTKHGDLKDKTLEERLGHIKDEVAEIEKAIANNDMTGEHGVMTESIQVACTAYKLWRSV